MDTHRLIPYSEKWLAYWRNWMDRYLTEPDFRTNEKMPLEAARLIIESWPDSEQSSVPEPERFGPDDRRYPESTSPSGRVVVILPESGHGSILPQQRGLAAIAERLQGVWIIWRLGQGGVQE